MSRSFTRGWPLVGWAIVVIGALVGVILKSRGLGPQGYALVLVATAITSTLCFLAAFTASSFQVLRPGPVGRWLVANRRYLGVSFAVSHTYHLAAILALAGSGQKLPIATIVLGGLAYAFLYAMAATSFDRTAGLLGPRRWKLLHRTGAYYVWFILIVTYATGGQLGARQLFFIGLLVAGLGVRIAAGLKTHRA